MMLLPIERFLRSIDKTETCWLWTLGVTDHGYGRLALASPQRTVYAHRFSYEYFVGPIPVGLHLDHLCRVRHCVNPDHLEPVTARENILRGVGCAAIHARRTHCIHGHEYTPENTRYAKKWPTVRLCIRCSRDRSALQDL